MKEFEKYVNMTFTGSVAETTSTVPLIRCEDCKHYEFIDSGYGYCFRFPPQIIGRERKNVIPVVAWCRKACGEFAP